MDRLKQFAIYILLIFALYVVTNFISYMYIANLYKDITEHKILTSTIVLPEVTITESKKTFINGYVMGEIKNNTGKDIPITYMRLDFYNKQEHYMGTRYVEIKEFKNGQVLEFKANFRYENVASYTISFETTPTKWNEDDIFTDTKSWYWFVGITGLVLFVIYIL